MSTTEGVESDNYLRFKRKIYLMIIPALVIAMISYWLFSPFLDGFTVVALPWLSLFVCVIWLLVYRNKAIQISEFLTLGLFSMYHVSRIYKLMNQLENDTFNLYILWCPLYFIFVFIAFQEKKGLLYALSVLSITVVIGLPHLNNSAREVEMLIQLFISHFIFIIVIYFFQRLISAHMEANLLGKMAFLDSLTKIGNRRMLDSRFEDELQKAKEQTRAFSIIYFDIDHFKSINDRYGHEAGDQVLTELAEVVQKVIGPNDHFGRWGGEEFVIVAAETTAPAAGQLAEKIRSAIDAHTFPEVGRITASFGIAGFRENDSQKSMFKRADEALYTAKHSGRNRVQVE